MKSNFYRQKEIEVIVIPMLKGINHMIMQHSKRISLASVLGRILGMADRKQYKAEGHKEHGQQTRLEGTRRFVLEKIAFLTDKNTVLKQQFLWTLVSHCITG